MNTNQSPPLHDVALDAITTGTFPEQPQKLTRRNRHVLLDFEVYDDHASAWFVRRGHSGEPVDESVKFTRENDAWRYIGGGGGPGADLTSRPTMAEVAQRNTDLSIYYRGPKFPGFSQRCDFAVYSGASYGPKRPVVLQMQMAGEVAELRFSDREAREVAEHGYVIVMHDPKRPPVMSAFDAAGSFLGEVGFERQSRLPWRR